MIPKETIVDPNPNKMNIRVLISLSFFLFVFNSYGQLIIDNTLTPLQLVEDILVGTGVSVSNVTYTGDPLSGTYFDGSASNIGLNAGVLLTTGYGDVAIGPNISNAATSTDPNDFLCFDGLCEPGDPDLDAILGNVSSQDAAVLEFDFIPLSDTIRFRYVFGSEEYPEYVCSGYNDIFAFLLSGGTTINYPAPGTNLAIIPGTVNTSVAINNVNSGVSGSNGNCDSDPSSCGGLFGLPCCTPADCELNYSAYYVDNTNGASIEFDGFTVVLEAVAEVTPCETYHIKLAIADAGDGQFDSGVFLEANSFTTGILDIDVATANLDSTVVESCSDVATVTFSFANPVTSDYTIPYTILGTATNGVDYTSIVGNATILSGQTSVDLVIDPVDDGIGEGTESVLIEVQSSVCTMDTVIVYIVEEMLLAAPTPFCSNTTQTSITFGWNTVPGATAYEISLDGGTTWISPSPGPLTHEITGLSQGDTEDIMVRALGGTLYCNENPAGTISCTTGNCVISTTTSSTDVSCVDDMDGTATVNVVGGTGPFTYTWDAAAGGQITPTANGLGAGNYSVTIDDALGCAVLANVSVGTPDLFSIINVASVNASCGGNNDGSAAISMSGGVSPYNYLWAPGGQITSAINNLLPGTYSCVVTDANGCIETTSINISGSSAMTNTLNNVILACNGDTNGSLDLEVSGGTAPYTYQWNNGAGTNQDPTGLSANTYIVTITDDLGCTLLVSAQVTEPSGITANVSNVALSCNGDLGSLNLTISGGSTPYTFDWNNGLSAAEDPSNLPAGNYTVVITDASNCTSTASASITEPTVLIATLPNNTIACNGGTGSLALTVTGGTAPYSFQWDNGAGTNQNPTGIGQNTYNVLVTDGLGCTATASAILTEPTALLASVSDIMLACNGDSNGSLDLGVSGGTPPYTFQWDNGGGINEDPTGLSANTYTVTIMDANACTISASAQVTEPTAMVASLVNSTPTTCTACIGTANISMVGGTAPYTYLWSNGEATEDATALCEGANSVLITDASNCSIVFNVNTLSNSTLSINGPIVVANPSCNGSCDASVSVSVNGGTAPFTYTWGGNTGNQSTNIASNLCAGTYEVTITDDNGCEAIGNITINDPPAITASTSVLAQVSCFGASDGVAQAFPAGGTAPYAYIWDNGEVGNTAMMLDQGSHTVTIADNLGCSTTAIVLIGQPSPLSATIGNLIPVNCASCDGGATVTVLGGTAPYFYAWSNGETSSSPSNLCEGSTGLTVTDSNGCIITATTGVSSVSTLNLTGISPLNSNCNGTCTGTATVNLSGGEAPFSYEWDTSPMQTGAVATNLCAGTYTVTITDVNGCEVIGSSSIVDPAPLGVTLTGADPLCAGDDGGLFATGSGGTGPYIYSWSTSLNGPSIPAPAGTHTLTVTDAQGCTIIDNITLIDPGPLTSTVASITDASCYGEANGAIALTVGGGTGSYQYLWDNTEITNPALYLTAGTHFVTVTDGNGCKVINSAQVNEPSELVFYDLNVNPILCYGESSGSASISVSGGQAPYVYEWTGGQATSTILALPIGNYWVSVTDANGCEIVPQNVVVTGPFAPLSLELDGMDPTCIDGIDGSIDATVSGGTLNYNYNWSSGGQGETATDLSSGNHSLTVLDANNCMVSDTYFLNNPTEIQATLTAIGTTCFGYTNGSISITNTTGGAGFYSYSIDGQNFQMDPNFYALTGGSYTVYIQDLEGCEVSYQILVEEPAEVIVVAGPSSLIQLGDSLQITSEMSVPGVYEYAWTNSTGSYMSCTDCPNPLVAPLDWTTYQLQVTDLISGCNTETTVIVHVEKDRNVFIPNVFTPNGDGTNDFFTVYGGPMVSNISLLRIFDRWGELLFEATDFPPNDETFGWNGLFKGKPMNPGVMVYYAEVEFIDGVRYDYEGGITILK